MATYQSLYRKAQVIMKESLGAFSRGNVKKGNALWKKANLVFENADRQLYLDRNKDKMLYGENINFGLLYHVFEDNSKRIYGTKKGNAAIAEIARMIMENKVLKAEFDTYMGLDKPFTGEDAKEVISESIKVIPNFTRKQIVTENKKLLRAIRKHRLNEMVDIDDDKVDLYNSIEYLMMHKKSVKNINECIQSEKAIINHLTALNENHSSNEYTTSYNEKYNDMLKEFSSKYGSEMTDAEESLVRKLTKEGADHEKIFNSYKNQVISIIKEKINESNSSSEKEGWSQILEKAERKVFDKGNSIALISDMAETKSKLERM